MQKKRPLERIMLTPTDLKNIQTFRNLTLNHQRVFKHRLKKKCLTAQKDLEFVLLHYEALGLKADKIIDISSLRKLIETFEELIKLQNR